MTDPFNRMVLSFSFGMVLQVYALIALLSVAVAVGYGSLGAIASRLPQAVADWFRRGVAAPFGAFGITVTIYLIWLHLPWSDFDSASVVYHKNFKWVWLALVGTLTVSRRFSALVARWGAKGLLALSPLPVILALHLSQFPPLGAPPTPPPSWLSNGAPSAATVLDSHAPDSAELPEPAAASSAPRGPIYLFVFDEWDRIETFRDSYDSDLPNLATIIKTATNFEEAVAVHDMTLHSVPSIVFQSDAPVNIDAHGVTHFQDGEQWVRARDLDSILTTFGAQHSRRVVIGRTLAFEQFLGDEATWLYQLPWDSGHYLSFSEACKAHLYRAYRYSHFPLHKIFGVEKYPLEFQAWANQQVHDQTLLTIRNGGRSVIGVFHYLVPHDPFIYDGEKIRAGYEDVGREAGYQDNLRFMDRWLGEIVDSIRQSGHWDDCTLILTADHGTFRGNDRRQLEIPLIVKLPGQTEARTVPDRFPVTEVVDWIERQ